MARFDKDKLFFLPVRAQVTEMELTEASVRDAINAAVAKHKGYKSAEAALSPVGPDDKPRMLQITAWIAHAPTPNLNRDAFRLHDLERLAAEGLFQAPFFGMVDLDHDWTPRGVWYSAEWAFDQNTGEWGLLAKGAIWAWRFPELAEYLLKRQEMKGYVDVSMGCVYLHSESKTWHDGQAYNEIHNPVFLTTSVLTEPPADPNANGIVILDGTAMDADTAATILKASLEGAVTDMEEIQMDELLTKIAELLGEQKAEIQPLIDAVAKLAEVEANLATATETIATLTAQTETLNGTVAALTGEKETLESAIATLTTEAATASKGLEAAQATITSLTEEAEGLRSFKSEIEAKEAEAAQAAKIEARKAEIPEVVMASLDLDKDEDKALFEGWMSQTDEQFEATKRTLSLASARKTHAERSAEEGVIPGTAAKGEGDFAINRWRGRTKKSK